MSAASVQDLLTKIDTLAAARDAAGLVALQDHAEKKVRKAVRKALHGLKSKGVAIPEPTSRETWTAGGLDALRGDLEDRAMIDTRSTPGATRWILSAAEPREGASLMIALVGPDGRMLDFSVGYQTDGQRARMLRDWERTFEGRSVPAEHVKKVLGWSRARTLELGFSVPPRFDEMHGRLGTLTQTTPESFVDGLLDATQEASGDDVETLISAGVPSWPILFDGNGLIEKLNAAATANKSEGEEASAPMDEDARRTMYTDAIAGDTRVREGLQGSIARALEDASIALWLEGRSAHALRIRQMRAELAASDACETLPWAVELVQMQVTSLAMQQMQQMQQGAAGPA